jgi:hypothetical protein
MEALHLQDLKSDEHWKQAAVGAVIDRAFPGIY